MATYADLEPLPNLQSPLSQSPDAMVAVGWLGRDRPFARGSIAEPIYRRLRELLLDPFQPFASAGLHGCELCQFEPEARGNTNLFVPGDGRIFVCPGLIVHYINAHTYQPPHVFCDAVLVCPDTRSMEYKRRLLANGGRDLVRAPASPR
jgi:hypothetical protein